MSFILDSLKRADQERRTGQQPTANVFYDDREPPHRRRMLQRYWMMGLLLANLSVIGILVLIPNYREQPTDIDALETTPPPSVTSLEDSPVSSTHSVAMENNLVSHHPAIRNSQTGSGQAVFEASQIIALTKETPAALSLRFGPPVPATARSDSADSNRVPPTSIDPVGIVQESADAVLEIEEQPSVLENPAPVAGPFTPPLQSSAYKAPDTLFTATANSPLLEDATSSLPLLDEPKPSEKGMDQKITKASKSGVRKDQQRALTPSSIPLEALPDHVDNVPLLHEIPPEIRKNLQDIKISVLVYETRQEMCKVYIDSRWYRQGDRIGSAGYILERIAQDGLVLDYGKGRVKIRSGY